MERLMSDLLATARGEQPKPPSYHYNTYHHAHHLIADEVRLGTTPLITDDHSSPTNVSSDSDYSSENNSSSDNDTFSSPSYTPLYSPSGYSSSPTYIRGDFYHPSPTSSPTLQTPTKPPSSARLSFSIESILGPTTHDEEVTAGSPAVVTSSLSTTSELYDWTVFQRKRSTNTSVPVVYWCHVCHSYCSSSTEANDHQTKHSRSREPHNLRRCFSDKHGYITSHVQTDYLNRIKCGLCDRIVTKCFFKKHMRCHESLNCRVCGLECATQTRLEDHMNQHAGYQPYTCKTCGAQFSDRRKQQNHSRQHRTSTVACRFCEKTFKTKYTCDVHERIHTGYRPFACNVPGCKKAFPQKVQLQLHMRLHGQ